MTCVSIDSSTVDCQCPDTHFGDANTSGCTAKVDECAAGTHDCVIAAGQECVDLEDGFSCRCIMQYAPDYGYAQERFYTRLNSHAVGRDLLVPFSFCFFLNPSASGARDLRLRQCVAKTQHLDKILF